MVEVRLIGIAVVECQIDPVDVDLLADGMYQVLKTLHAAEKFWCHPHFVAKEFDESPLAESDTLGNFRTSGEARILFGTVPRQKSLQGDAGMAGLQSPGAIVPTSGI